MAPESPALYSREAELTLAAKIREARADAGVTQRQVAAHLGLDQASYARYETRQRDRVKAPTHDQIQRIAGLFGTSPDQLLVLRNAVDRARMPTMADVLRASGTMQQRVAELERAASWMHSFFPTVVPGTLQTETYMRTIWAGANVTGQQLEDSVAARLSRRELLAEPHRQWTIVTTEGALRWPLGGPAVMAEQCRYLTTIDLPNVRLGVVPMSSTATASIMHGADIYGTDPAEAMIGTLLGTALLSQEDDPDGWKAITEHFAVAEQAAVFGDEARAVFAETAALYESLDS